jgi:isoamylase/glycogen operon protein
MHVRSFTQHPSSHSAHPGTFLGIIEKIPYLKSLGVNAVELMPIHEFDETEYHKKNPKTGSLLFNYWGYSTINFFCPMNRYGSKAAFEGPIEEFKMMVKELHRNQIEVILDVVFNHTAEGPLNGPTFSFRGIDNSTYYILDENGGYKDYSGCGNTFNCNHPIPHDLIVESLKYWVQEMHVDGFRFDLASILTRDQQGEPLTSPPVVEMIVKDPLLSNTKLIAEAWDAGGLYQVGSFPAFSRWAEWNGKYRDVVRRFIKGTDQQAGEFAKAITGSQDLYGVDRDPYHSVNFVTAHDGFTLKDLVSYQEKHNEENGEENRDGSSNNDSWNCGHEGETKNHAVQLIRARQMRNFHLALMLSLGVPMLLMGDEYGHTRRGNNNAWCQDNELNWFLWDEIKQQKDFFRFYKLVNHLRKKEPLLRRTSFLTNDDIDWHGHQPLNPDWDSQSRFVAFTLKDHLYAKHLYVAFNAHYESAHITLSLPPPSKKWYRIIDTSLPSPDDFLEDPHSQPPLKHTYTLLPYSALLAYAL